jgi:hypothetical protein
MENPDGGPPRDEGVRRLRVLGGSQSLDLRPSRKGTTRFLRKRDGGSLWWL